MATKKPQQPAEEQSTPPVSEQGPKSAIPPALPHRPGVGSGSVDFTGVVPEGIRIDPDITEGHPGYEESGDSEIIPPKPVTGEGKGPEKPQARSG
jgi:hypothetical protein